MGRRKKVVTESTAATAAKIEATPRRLKIVVYAIAKNEITVDGAGG